MKWLWWVPEVVICPKLQEVYICCLYLHRLCFGIAKYRCTVFVSGLPNIGTPLMNFVRRSTANLFEFRTCACVRMCVGGGGGGRGLLLCVWGGGEGGGALMAGFPPALN